MIKPGVDLRGPQPQMAVAYTIACSVWSKHWHEGQCVITSATDGTHGTNSLHYKGLALDLRTRDIVPAILIKIEHDLRIALGQQFDVVLEDDHLHLEYDPKDK